MKTIRRIFSINTADFSKDILSSSLYHTPATNLSDFTVQFHEVLSNILDKHAPQKTVTCRTKASKPFITSEIKSEKAKRLRLEAAYRKNKSDNDIKIASKINLNTFVNS